MVIIKRTIILLALIGLFSWILRYIPQVVFLDVGQGDAALIKTLNKKIIVIDGGPDWQILYNLGKHLKPWQRRIDALVISHFHHDHFLGLAEVMRRYDVQKIYYYPIEIYDLAYIEFMKIVKDSQSMLVEIKAGDIIQFDNNCWLKILWPKIGASGRDLNRLSLVLRLECGNQKILFTGDVDKAVEEILITEGNNVKADILKSAHHGSASSNSLRFLQAVQPRHFVISVGKDNRYGLPSPSVISRGRSLGLNIWRTDLFKNIVFFLD